MQIHTFLSKNRYKKRNRHTHKSQRKREVLGWGGGGGGGGGGDMRQQQKLKAEAETKIKSKWKVVHPRQVDHLPDASVTCLWWRTPDCIDSTGWSPGTAYHLNHPSSKSNLILPHFHVNSSHGNDSKEENILLFYCAILINAVLHVIRFMVTFFTLTETSTILFTSKNIPTGP